MRTLRWLLCGGFALCLTTPTTADEPTSASRAGLSRYFPPPEGEGGWRTLLPEKGDPNADQKAAIRREAGVDWDKLSEAWEHNARPPGKTGLLVIRRGYVVGEWYKDADRSTAFNIYSSSKSYTSTAYGLILADFGNGKLPDGRTLSLDTKVCNADWLPESLPLPDPRKADITVRHLLNMASGLGEENPPREKPFEWSFGHVDGSPMKTLKGDPGRTFHYSNAGVAHLAVLFPHAQGSDLYPFLEKRLLTPIGVTHLRWQTIGGDGAIGPFSQGYSGIHTSPREHARFCYLALHRGEWEGRRIVPESYYDFAWKGSPAKADYGGQWWINPHIPDAPRDLVLTLGRNHNDGIVVPSLDLVAVRLGDGESFPKDFEKDLVMKILAAVEK